MTTGVRPSNGLLGEPVAIVEFLVALESLLTSLWTLLEYETENKPQAITK